VLAAYKLLQQLYDRKIFSLLLGMLGAGDEITEKVVEALDGPANI
jgi:hypothetical protein